MSNKNYNIWFKNKRKRKTVGENFEFTAEHLFFIHETNYMLPATNHNRR